MIRPSHCFFVDVANYIDYSKYILFFGAVKPKNIGNLVIVFVCL